MKKTSIENKIINDSEFVNIVNDILSNEQFIKMKYIEQHGTTRYLHSLKVAHMSYKISKKLKFDYMSTARAALLHDFYEETKDSKNFFEKAKLCISEHAIVASENSKNLFKINLKEENIIKSHMFPFGKTIPKYKESIVVDLVDDIVATEEFGCKYKNLVSYSVGLIILLIKNNLF